ncbi:MAG: hypothetical protein JW774_07480, partial [Candidatus Aureabacteria bacterium]|nr:hypothetical protein [Candidatus Auribacterota bacterium]
MLTYIFRRLLLMVPTFIGATFLMYTILDLAPGGPFERALMELKQGSLSNEGTQSFSAGVKNALISPKTVELLRKQYGLDRPFLIRYLIWMGLWKRELKNKTMKIGEAFREDIRYVNHNKTIYAIQKWIRVIGSKHQIKAVESGVGSDFKFSDEYDPLPDIQDITDWEDSAEWMIEKTEKDSVRLVKKSLSGILTGDLGISYVYDEPVTQLIRERLPISCYFGLLGFFLSYVVCIPLGIWKALKHGTFFDLVTSMGVFIGYSIPGYILGALLLVYFGGGSFWNLFPLGG